jgi:parvulin-like peptidyl-prolyl isomerase
MAEAPKKSAFWDRMAEVHPGRSLALFALGTALGLGIAAYGLFNAPGTRIAGVPAEDVALINGRHILRSDFITQTQLETSLPFAQTTAAQRRKVLNDMINEEILVQRGLEVDLAASDPDVRMAMVTGVQLQVDADILALEPGDDVLQKYYADHMDKYSGEAILALRDFIIRPSEDVPQGEAMAKAKQAAEAFRKGGATDNIAASFGLMDSGKIDRGDTFDFAVKIKLEPALYQAATKLEAHQSSDPIVVGGLIHVVMMEKHDRPAKRTFANVRDAVMQDFKRDEQTRVEQANLQYLKSKADIQLAPEFRQ